MLALAAGVIVLLVAFALPVLRMGGSSGALAGDDTAAGTGLPWQVSRLGEGRTQVFGLEPGRDTLAQVQARLGDALQVALVARLGEQGALEALADPFMAGFVSGRLVLAFDVPASQLQAWRAGAGSSEPMEGGVRRFKLRADHRQQAAQARLVGLSFLPAVRLTGDDVRQRFGAPAEALDQPGGAQVLLYPELGLSATVAPGQRGVLQYVSPADFADRLRAPLLAAAQQAGQPPR
ncbi:hypothetical protein AQPW35_18090 [Rubrivivax pictus]|uniref:Uncharacterized protein n=1 Tax=Pseudaquabacterium pictum TaxID=2315236 RepID=A0A480AVB7_9BURK|nr:hypothetical protein AQPW35_18090 [Rubrivivax pictus]